MDESELERSESDLKRCLRSTPDWDKSAKKYDHLWGPTNVSGDFCYIGSKCTKNGTKLKCSSCNIIAHQRCLKILILEMGILCKTQFEDISVEDNRRATSIKHHWIRRPSEKNKCKRCTKNLHQCKPFKNEGFIAISCSWCKSAYHDRENCFDPDKVTENCNLGIHRKIIVPPTWILKLPEHRISGHKENEENEKKNFFLVRAIPTDDIQPLIVFINPKSGGNQGIRLLQKFQWFLNPRQVFDLTQGGPKMGLTLYQKVPNLKVLACGGDGTVGWVLSVIDQIGMNPPPAVGVLPLGTGNDLARALGWGGGYTDEPVSEILSNMSKSQPVLLDRWKIDVESNPNAPPSSDGDGKDNLPLNVVNNYFSMGVDAYIAHEFHEAREANPKKFNSRVKNKMFYGQLGGKDLLVRKWKNLSDYITLECDGNDFTQKLKELKVHAIVFLNIPSYGGGTRPWNKSSGHTSTEDGLIEVVGLTTYQLPLLQAGGHGTCITQCKTAKIATSKTIPMQVDGEACKVNPSILTLSHLNRATMLASRKGGIQRGMNRHENISINVQFLSTSTYEKYRFNIELLKQTAIKLHVFDIDFTSDLGLLRDNINSYLTESKDERLSDDWYFLDVNGVGRSLKIDKSQENLYYVTDIINENIYLVESSSSTRTLTPKNEREMNETSNSNVKPKVNARIKTNKPNVKHNEHVKRDMNVKQNVNVKRNTKISNSNEFSKKTRDEKIPPKTEYRYKRKSLAERLLSVEDESCEYYRFSRGVIYGKLVDALKKNDMKEVESIFKKSYPLRSRESCNLFNAAATKGNEDVPKYLIQNVYVN